MINVSITPYTLCDLCGGRFTLEACEAIGEYLNEVGNGFIFSVGDICVSFGEMRESDMDEDDEERVIAHLSNGNAVVTW